MRVLTFTNLPYENNLYRVIQGSIALHSMIVTLNKEHKKHFRLNEEAIILFKATESSRSVSKNILIQPAIYTITEIETILKQNIPHIQLNINNDTLIMNIPKRVQLIIPKNLRKLFGFNLEPEEEWVETKIIGKLLSKNQPSSIYLYCDQIDDQYQEVDGQPSKLLCQTEINDGKAIFNPKHLIYLPLANGIHHWLEFRLVDENNKVIKPKSIRLTILNKE